MAGLIGVRECSGHDVTKFRDVAHVNAPHSRIKRESPAHGSVSLFLRSKNADKVLIVERRDNERMIRKTGFFHYPVNLRSEEHTSELQSRLHLVCRLLLEKKKLYNRTPTVRA